jgi:recombination protein RecA
MPRSKAESLADYINRLLGEGTVQLGSDPSFAVKFLPTGVLPIDYLLEGGIPRGRFVEMYGSYSSLKSWIALRAIARTQEDGGKAGLVDPEHAFDPIWAVSNGVDTDSLVVMHPPTGEDAVNVMEVMIRNQFDLVVWDSIAATLPKVEQEKSAKDPVQPARLAALMSSSLRKLNAANSRTGIICINQTRLNVGQVFGNPEVTPGGKAMGFYASYRLSLSKAGKVTEPRKIWDGEKYVNSKVITRQKVKAVLEKSKLSTPHRESWFLFDPNTGDVDEVDFLVAVGLEKGFVYQKGQSWGVTGSKKMIRGRVAFLGYINENPKVKSKLRTLCLGSAAPASKRGG